MLAKYKNIDFGARQLKKPIPPICAFFIALYRDVGAKYIKQYGLDIYIMQDAEYADNLGQKECPYCGY